MRVRPGAAAFALLALAGVAHADAGRCQRVLVAQSARHARAVMRARAQCRARVLTGALPATTDCTADAGVTAASARSVARVRARIARRCCGRDGACGTADDVPLAALGWDAAVCPGLGDAPCANAIANPGDLGVCLTCTGAAAADSVAGLAGIRVGPPAFRRCQTAIAAAGAGLFLARSRILARCACPATAEVPIARAAAAARTRICRACGGADGRCGGGDDLDPTALGLPPACPAVTWPGGSPCAAALATVDALATCVACVAAFASECAHRLAVPAIAPAPAECLPASPVCEGGVQCADAAGCPRGYDCRDNGGGARYCVGGECTADTACGGGGVCRQYCTHGGCGPRRCQCPGFACSGADTLCLDDGDLACRKVCTQDSDCAGPFALVCINSGFGAGLCIGSEPCQ